MIDYARDFFPAVKAAGLVPVNAGAIWQIRGGSIHSTVDCWPNHHEGDIGFRPLADLAVTDGTIADAIALAGPPENPKEDQATTNLADVREKIKAVAREALTHWDRDEDAKVGKLLNSLAGNLVGHYRNDIDDAMGYSDERKAT